MAAAMEAMEGPAPLSMGLQIVIAIGTLPQVPRPPAPPDAVAPSRHRPSTDEYGPLPWTRPFHGPRPPRPRHTTDRPTTTTTTTARPRTTRKLASLVLHHGRELGLQECLVIGNCKRLEVFVVADSATGRSVTDDELTKCLAAMLDHQCVSWAAQGNELGWQVRLSRLHYTRVVGGHTLVVGFTLRESLYKGITWVQPRVVKPTTR